MQRAWLLLIVVLSTQNVLAAPIGIYQRGTIVRMRMSPCLPRGHGLMATLSGTQAQEPVEFCPEYTLVTEKVVYLIVGKMSSQLLPLAETTNFRFQKNEVVVRVDDESHEARFQIKEMTLRPQWEHEQQLRDDGGDGESTAASASVTRRSQ